MMGAPDFIPLGGTPDFIPLGGQAPKDPLASLQHQSDTDIALGGLKAAGKHLGVAAGQVLDMINPAPMVTHLLSYIGNKKILAQDKGMSDHQVTSQAKNMADIAAEWAGSGVFEKLAREFIDLDGEETSLTAFNNKVGSFIKQIGRDYQSRTNGAVQAEDVEEMANVAMLGLMARAGGTGAKAKAPKPKEDLGKIMDGLEEPPVDEAPNALSTGEDMGPGKRRGARKSADPSAAGIMGKPETGPVGLGAGEGQAPGARRPVRKADPAAAGLEGRPVTPEPPPAGLSTGEGLAAKTSRQRPMSYTDPLNEGTPAGLSTGEGLAGTSRVTGKSPDTGLMGDGYKAPAGLRQAGKIDRDVLIALGVGGAAAAVVTPIVLNYLDGRTKREDAEKELDKALRDAKPDTGSGNLDKPLFTPKKEPGDPVPMPRYQVKPPEGPASSAKEIFDWMDRNKDKLQKAGLGLGAILALHPKTPLKDIHPDLSYTTKVLTDLNDNLGGKAEFTREHILQRANKPNVGKFEREMFQDIVKDRESISAKDLVAEVKKRTGDFELRPEETDEFADYGLEGIRPAGNNAVEVQSGYGFNRVDPAVATARTTIYQSPLELGDANHFGDPNYFAHTRSFDEGGVRHVVEIQSDLAQKAGKALTEEERTSLQTRFDEGDAQAKLIEDNWGHYRHPSPIDAVNVLTALKTVIPDVEADVGKYFQDRGHYSDLSAKEAFQKIKETAFDQDAGYDSVRTAERLLADAAERYREGARVRLSELRSKLASSAVDPVRPMLKDWYKRIVREEVAEAQQARADWEYNPNEGSHGDSIRFATADTVAKVEGWRDRQAGWDAAQGQGLTDREIRSQPRPEARFSPEHQGIYDRYKKDIETFLTKEMGGRPHTDAQGHTWIEVPLPEAKNGKIAPTRMMGKSDPALTAYITAVGGSAALAAYITDEDPGEKSHRKVRNAGITAAAAAVAGLIALRKSTSVPIAKAAKDIVRGLEDAAGNMSYQLEKISAPATRTLRQYDRLLATGIHDRLQRIAGWAESFRDLPTHVSPKVSAALLSGSFKEAVNLVPESMRIEFAKGLVEALRVVKEVGDEASGFGMLKNREPNYFPRRVADYEGLMGYLGNEARSYVEKLLHEAEVKSGGKLTEADRARILNSVLKKLMTERTSLPLSSNLRKRSIREINEGTAQFYEPAAESLISYVRSMTQSIEQARFFGKNAVTDTRTGAINLDASIGNVFAEELASGKMSLENFHEASRLLAARFGPGERGMGRLGRAISGATSSALLANPFSAAMNLQDIAGNSAVYGILPTVKAVASILTRKASRVTTADMGLANVIGEEFVGGASSPVTVAGRRISMSWFVEKTMRRSGFSLLDLFGKETTLNASVIAARSKLKSAAGDLQFTKAQGDYFGKDLAQLKDDLRAGRKTELTFEYAFRELADMQPISRSEMPTMALQNPRARLIWQMKHYAIKQLTVVRKRGIDEIRKGNVREGTEFLLRYGLLVGAAGAGMDYLVRSLQGHDETLEASDVPMQALKNFGMSQMLVEKAKEGKLRDAAALLVSPAAYVMLDLASQPDDALKYVPIVGKWLAARKVDESGKTKAERQDDAKAKREKAAEKKKLERELGMKL